VEYSCRRQARVAMVFGISEEFGVNPSGRPEEAAGKGLGLARGRAASLLACSLLGLSVLLSVMAVVFAVLDPPEPVLDVASVAMVLAIPFPAVGLLIVSRQPGNAIGWIFCAIGLFEGLNVFSGQYGRYALLARPGSLPGGGQMISLESWTWVPSLALLTTLLLLLFPEGRLPSARWRWAAWMAAGGLALVVIPLSVGAWAEGGVKILCSQRDSEAARAALKALCASEPVQTGGSVLLPVIAVGMVATGASAVASVASLVVRFRRSRGVERQQIKWFAFAGVVAFACVAAMFTPLDEYRSVLSLGILAIPISVGIAILRYRLYDIDLIINRTLVYVALTAIVVGVYVLAVGYLGAVFRTEGNLAISVLAAGVVAVLFAPLRNRLQRVVNRLMYGERDEPYGVLSRLGRRLDAALDPDTVLPTIVGTIREALKLPYAAIALPGDRGGFEVAAASGEPTDHSFRTPLSYQGETVGELLVGPRAPGEEFSAADRRLLEDLAHQAGVAVHGVRTMADLQRSRERLVLAREEERRRLRRDLHDELAPTLAALGLSAATVGELIESDPERAAAANEKLRMALRDAVGDVRRLAYDLRPPALDELGLAEAVRERAVRYGPELQVRIETSELPQDVPAAVEVAAYRIVQEALMNASRHAKAGECTVRLACPGGRTLEVEVTDDGIGMPASPQTGIGLRSMRERASELGGTYEIGRAYPNGTTLIARLPLTEPGDHVEERRE
jgi:signal transduction histidine kinase